MGYSQASREGLRLLRVDIGRYLGSPDLTFRITILWAWNSNRNTGTYSPDPFVHVRTWFFSTRVSHLDGSVWSHWLDYSEPVFELSNSTGMAGWHSTSMKAIAPNRVSSTRPTLWFCVRPLVTNSRDRLSLINLSKTDHRGRMLHPMGFFLPRRPAGFYGLAGQRFRHRASSWRIFSGHKPICSHLAYQAVVIQRAKTAQGR